MITTLAIDTTSKFSSVAVLRDDMPVMELNFLAQDKLSSYLLPGIDFVLAGSQVKLTEVDLFGISVGPGLFTGIRIGLTTLKGMLSFRQKPITAVPSLKALACKCTAQDAAIVSIMDAKRGEVYLAVYAPEGEALGEILDPCLIPFDHLGDYLSGLKNMVFTGSGAKTYRDQLIGHYPGSKLITHRSDFLAPEIGRIAFQDYQAGNYYSDPAELIPLYLRKSDAEKNRTD